MLTDEEDDTSNQKKDLNAFTAKLRERREARRLSEYQTLMPQGGGTEIGGNKANSRSVSTIHSRSGRGSGGLGKDSGQASAEQVVSAASGVRAAKTMGKSQVATKN